MDDNKIIYLENDTIDLDTFELSADRINATLCPTQPGSRRDVHANHDTATKKILDLVDFQL